MGSLVVAKGGSVGSLVVAKGGSVGSLVVAKGGSVVKLRYEGRQEKRPGLRVRRGEVTAFTKRSRRRLFQLLGSVNAAELPHLPLMLTLTYPRDYPRDPAAWKRHLDTFAKRLQREYPTFPVALIWRLEPQKRGAPHFHVLIFGLPFLPHRWVGEAWSTIVGGDELHQRRCMRVERVRAWRGVMSYASKYLAKTGDEERAFRAPSGAEIELVGRYWGVIGRQHLPVEWVSTSLSRRDFYRLRRQLARFMRSRGRRVRLSYQCCGIWCFLDAATATRLIEGDSSPPRSPLLALRAAERRCTAVLAPIARRVA